MTAEELVTRLRGGGANVRRTHEPPGVFVITRDERLVEFLRSQGGRVKGSYQRNPWGAKHLGEELITEWDVVINTIEVEGDLWEAARDE